MTHKVKGREIFATGTHNGMDFTEQDLDDIMTNFAALLPDYRVPLKFGHDADHDGEPAIGWVERVYREGSKLLADFSDVPTIVFEAIKKKLYRTISIELLFNVDDDGRKFNLILDAVALLGADRPAVGTLADLDKLLASRTKLSGGRRVSFETTAGKTVKISQEDTGMDEKQVQALIDKATKPLVDANAKLTVDLEAANKLNATFKADKAEADDKAKKDAITLARDGVTKVLDAAVESKAMTPAMRETYAKQIGVDDDERVVEIELDEVKAMFSVKEDENGNPIGLHKSAEDDPDDPEAEMLALVYKSQADTGKTFAVAFAAVQKANPKLHRAYLDSNGEA